MRCRRRPGCCAPPGRRAAGRRWPGRSTPTTMPPGTSARSWPWPASTPRNTPDRPMDRPDAEGDRMRISPPPTLAARLGIGGLAAWAACAALPAAAAVLAPASEASQCQAVPVTSTTSPSASASASGSASAPASSPAPADLCVTVQGAQDSYQAGTTGTWTVVIWAHNGPVTGVSVTLTGTIAGQQPTFTARCPGGDGGPSCLVGNLATDVAASSYEMQAQMAIPSGTAAN